MLSLLLIPAILYFIFVVVINVTKNRRKIESFQLPPGPKGLPLIGNLHKFEYSNTHIYLAKLGKLYGSMFALRLTSKTMIVVQSVKLAQEILQTHDKNICNRPITAGRKRLSYGGIDIGFSPHNEYLREMKKILVVHLLNSKKVQSYIPILKEEVSRLIQKVNILSSASKTINVSELVLAFSSSNAGRITFGKRYNDEDMLGSKYYSLLHETEGMLQAFFYSDYFPLGGLLDKITGKSSRLEKVFKDLDTFFQKIVDDHLNANNKLKSQPEDIVDVLIRFMNEPSFAFKLTVNNIKAILMNIFLGGANTTTAGVIWALMELVKNPIPMKKVQEELRILGRSKGCIEEADIPKLEYFKAMAIETFRMHPPAPLLIPREAEKECIVSGYKILPKSIVILNAWAIGRDPEYWKDPEIFMPERFMGKSIDLKGLGVSTKSGMYPFGGGRRACPGYDFGVTNLELALANLLYSFDWEMPPGLNEKDIDNNVLPGLVTHKENQLCLVAKKFSQ